MVREVIKSSWEGRDKILLSGNEALHSTISREGFKIKMLGRTKTTEIH